MAKTYGCPYCSDRYSREDLVGHIEDEHEDLLGEDMSPSRTVFNLVNNKTHGVCVVCKRETEWRETVSKYGRLCGRKQCADVLRKKAVDGMIKVYNKPSLLDDTDHQTKMLANRGISGKYRFTDGGYHVYTGSYEKKTLEFLDKVLGFLSSDILCPGLVFEYEYKGETRKWITDILLIPFNLVIEVKDGGSNPNNRQMPDYRAKQDAKEEMITSLGKFSYLRLTDNDFSQLLYTIAELKAQFIDDSEDNKRVVININEEVEALEEGILDFFKKKLYYISSDKNIKDLSKVKYHKNIGKTDIKDAAISMIYRSGIKFQSTNNGDLGEAKEVFISSSQKSILNEQVYLYEMQSGDGWEKSDSGFTPKKEATKFSVKLFGTIESLFEKINTKINFTDPNKFKERKKVLSDMISAAATLLSKYPEIKKGFSKDKNHKADQDDFIKGDTHHCEILAWNIWDVTSRARDPKEMQRVNAPLNKYIKEIQSQAPNGYKINLDGDWDTASLYLYDTAYANEAYIEESVSNKVYYHGSTTSGLKKFTPKVSTHGKPYVYSTDDRTFALLNIGKDPYKRDEYVNTGYMDGKLYIKEMKKDALEKAFKGTSGSIYSVDKSKFKHVSGMMRKEFVSTNEVDVKSEENITDALEYIYKAESEGKIKIYKFEDSIKESFEDFVLEQDYLEEKFNPKINAEDQKPHHGVAAIIKDSDGKLLMLKHVKYGFWTIPVGKVKQGQSIEAGLVEEVYEETNVKLLSYKEISSYTQTYNMNGIMVPVTGHIFLADKWSGKVMNKESHKHSDLKWMSISGIKKIGAKGISHSTMVAINALEGKEIYNIHESHIIEESAVKIGAHSDVLEIFNSLTKDEQESLSGGKYENSPYLVYRKVYKIDNKNAGFIEVINYPDVDKDEKNTGFVLIAIKKEFRGQGLSKTITDETKEYFKKNPSGLKSLIWKTDNDNKGSIKLAKKSGFKLNKKNDKTHTYDYKLKSNIHESFEDFILEDGEVDNFLEVLEEAVKLQKVSEKDWKDILKIHSSLSTQEKKFLGGRFINSPNTAFTKIYRENGEPVAFVQGYDFHEGEIILEIAVASSARGKGYGSKGISDLVAFAKSNGYNRIVYLVKEKNTASITLAKRAGFKYSRKEHSHFIYIMTISNSLKENMGLAGIGGIPGTSTFITQFGPKATFSDDVEGYAIHNDIITDKVITVDKNSGRVRTRESSFLQGRKIRMFKYIGEDTSGYNDILNSVDSRKHRAYLYEALTGKRLLSDDQILCDECFKEISPSKIFSEYTAVAQTIIDQYKEIVGEEVIRLPLMNDDAIKEASKILGNNTHIKVFENMNGYFAENAITRERTAYFKNVSDIEIGVIE